MPLPIDERDFLAQVEPPEHRLCVARANEFCARVGFSATQFAEALRREYGRGGRSTILFYLRGDYAKQTGRELVTTFMDARVWDFCNRNWPKPPKEIGSADPLLETRGYRKISECFDDALEGINSLIYGPPSAEKSFVLEHLAHQHRERAVYFECSPGITQMSMLRRISREAGVYVNRAWSCEHYIEGLIDAFAARPEPPVLILDEAQLVPLKTLEEIRILHNRTRRRGRPGCGIILAGSHNLFQQIMRRASEVEQLLSRFPRRVQLEGMDRDEVLEIAARVWNPNGKRAKFTPEIEHRILASCEVADPYATDAHGHALRDGGGKPIVRTYYSPRRLQHFLREQKKNLRAVTASTPKEGVA